MRGREGGELRGAVWVTWWVLVASEIRLVRLSLLFAAKDGEVLHSQQNQDLELTVAQIMNFLLPKFRLKLKKVGENHYTIWYSLVPYSYTVEVRNRFKGLDLIDRVPDELWMEVHDIVQEAVIKTNPKKKKCKKVEIVRRY